jgi:hypothetical protein
MSRSKSANTQAPVSNAPLTALELQVTGEFVSAAGRSYIDHSCNDFDLPDTPVRRALVQAAIGCAKRAGFAPEPLYAQGGVIHYQDDQLMAYLGPRWVALSERAAAGPLSPPLCREELETMASVLDMLARNESKEYATLGEAADYSLPLTPEGQQFAEAVTRHAGGADARIPAAKFGYDIHTIQCLKYLAARCQALANVSPDMGLAFTGIVKAAPLRAEASAQSGAGGTIPLLARPGVGSNWLRKWKQDVDESKKYRQNKVAARLETKCIETLKNYAAGGNVSTSFPEVSPPFRSWENEIRSYCGLYAGAVSAYVIEEEALTSNSFLATQWRLLFAGSYVNSFGQLHEILLHPVRFKAKPFLDVIDYLQVFYAALGMAMGFREHALRLVRLYVLAHRLECFAHPLHMPAMQAILRIFTDYLGEPEIALKGEALTHPIYNALARHWRHPEAEPLVPLLLAVCDEHTRRTTRGRKYETPVDFEFFARTPVEILLVFKLREELGLPNPKLDHPLMNTLLGVLPQEIPFEFDELLAPVVKRMRQDGFDEEVILADFVAAVNKQ